LIDELSPDPSALNLRAVVLKQAAENALLQQAESNPAFVLMQYSAIRAAIRNDAPAS